MAGTETTGNEPNGIRGKKYIAIYHCSALGNGNCSKRLTNNVTLKLKFGGDQ